MAYSRTTAWITVLLASLVPARADADEPLRDEPLPIELTWSGPPECRDDGQVGALIRSMLADDRPISSPSGSDVRIVVNAVAQRQANGAWRVTLVTRTGDVQGERTLVDEDCDAIRKATALLLALMIDPNAGTHSRTTKTPSSPKRVKPPATPQTSPNAERPRPSTAWSLGIDGVVDSGSLPAWGYGARIAVGLVGQQWSALARVEGWLPRSTSRGGPGGRFGLWQQSLVACGSSRRSRRIAVEGCAGAALLSMHGEGYGATAGGSAWATWPAATADVGMRVGLSTGLGLHAMAGAQYGPSPPSFAIRNVGVIHTPKRLAERLSLGLSYQF